MYRNGIQCKIRIIFNPNINGDLQSRYTFYNIVPVIRWCIIGHLVRFVTIYIGRLRSQSQYYKYTLFFIINSIFKINLLKKNIFYILLCIKNL